MNSKTLHRRHAALGTLVAVLAAAAAWTLASFGAHAAKAADAPPPILEHVDGRIVIGEGSPLRASLQIQTVSARPIEIAFALPAAVEADAAKLVKVLPPAAGRIASLDKQLGDSVRPGDVLFRIDAPDVSQAVADAQKARSAMTLAARALDRQRALGASDIAATRDIEQAQSDLDQAKSESGRADAKLAQWGATGARAGDGRTLPVRSPIGGRVVESSAAAGDYWNDTTAALMTVADLSSVFVSADADERDLAAIFVGQAVRVAFDAFPGEVFAGRVHDVGERLDADTRRVKVRMRFDNRDRRLKPGMFAAATFLGRAHAGVSVPLTAVVQSGFDARVFVEVAPWRFEPRVVRLGARIGDRVEIASGLAAGERVVVRDGILLND